MFVGHVADRYDHRIILMLCQITEACAAAILVYATATGSLGTPVIYVVVAVVGSARAFEIPTMAAIISSLVPRAVVPSAMAWFASANQTGQIVGPALGGVLYLLGPTTVYGVTIVLWGLGGVMLALMRVEPRAALAPSRSVCARCSAASVSCGTTASSSARCRSTCSRCFSAARPRCCRSSPATFC